MNTFELAEIEATQKVAERKRDELLEKVQLRLEELELSKPILSEPITKLTPNDDLEAVKRAVNHIIDVLSKN